jgi:hypothetical protein
LALAIIAAATSNKPTSSSAVTTTQTNVVVKKELSSEERKSAYLKEREKEGWSSCVWMTQIDFSIEDKVDIAKDRYYRQEDALNWCHAHPQVWKPFGGKTAPADFKVPDDWKPAS